MMEGLDRWKTLILPFSSLRVSAQDDIEFLLIVQSTPPRDKGPPEPQLVGSRMYYPGIKFVGAFRETPGDRLHVLATFGW